MLVNSTKTTLPVFKIAISWNNEDGFNIINKIIQLFKWFRVNAVFEPIDIAGENYQKKIKYGIDESNLTHLINTNILIHTKFNYDFLRKEEQMNVEKYLNFVMQNYFIKFFQKNNDHGDNYNKFYNETNFFQKNKNYIANINDIKFKDKNFTFNDNVKDFNFSFSFGYRYAIFNLNSFYDYDAKNFAVELLKYLNLESEAKFVSDFKTIDETINELKKNKTNIVSYTKIENITKEENIVWKKFDNIIPSELKEENNEITGIFKVCDIVNDIKEKKIKLPDELELYQIISNEIEYYPNINFWNEYIVNPIIKLKKIEIKKIYI